MDMVRILAESRARMPVRVRRSLGLAFVTGLLCLPGSSPAQSTTKARVGLNFSGQVTRDLLRFEAESDRIAGMGAGWVRLEASWAQLENDGVRACEQSSPPPSCNLGNLDWAVIRSEAKGLSVLLVIDYTPGWARDPMCQSSGPFAEHCAPAASHVADFGAFVRTIVRRYGPNGIIGSHVTAYEIWNEPNLNAWAGVPVGLGAGQPAVPATRYAPLLAAASSEIKSFVPTATVLGGALAAWGDSNNTADQNNPQWPVKYTADLVTALDNIGASTAWTGLSFHPYSFPEGPGCNVGWNGMNQALGIHNVFVFIQNPNFPIWGTEAGAPTTLDAPNPRCPNQSGDDNNVPENYQTLYLAQYYAQWNQWSSWTGPLFWYNVRNDGPDSTDLNNNFGLLHDDYTPKQAVGAFELLTKPAPTFSDGFETGNLSSWTATGNKMTVQSAVVASQQYAALANLVGAGAGFARKTLPATLSDGYGRVYVNVAALPSAASGYARLMRFQKSGGGEIGYVAVGADGHLRVHKTVAPAVERASAQTLSSGAWHLLEWRVKIGASNTGATTVWLDGAPVGDLSTTAETWGTAPITAFQIGEQRTGLTYAIRYDNAAISTVRVGP
jgi:hypothetical protein